MDREQEAAQFLGFLGIIKESINIVLSWRKIFTKITLSLILPLSIIFLGHIVISQSLYGEIFVNEIRLFYTQVGTPKYEKLSDIIASEYATFFVFTIVYYIFLLILSLLSTSAVVYTIACIYTGKEITFKKVMSVVPKVWKRLMVTFIWSAIIICAYNFVSLLILSFWAVLVLDSGRGSFLIFLILYIIGLVYLSVVWHLASIVSVLEDLHGIQAIIKSKTLIQGKTMVAAALYTLLHLSLVLIQGVVVFGAETGKVNLGYGFFSLLIMVVLILFGLVIQTILYFICKSYHHENIDKSSLADHLEEYLGEYVPLKGTDVQLEQAELGFV